MGFPPGADLEAELAALCERAHRAHPGLALDDEAFATFLACLPASEDEESQEAAPLAALKIEDLYLACACLAGAPDAFAAFEARCAGAIGTALASTVTSPEARAEAAQRFRSAFLVGTPDEPAKLAGYTGRWPLDRWTAICAQRLAVSMIRHEDAGRRAHERASLEAALVPQQPEVAFVKEQYRGEFERAFAEALATLSERDRLLMRLHLVTGVSVADIGKMYGVSQPTASRWLAAARETVGDEVRRLLNERLHLAHSEMASLAGLVASQLDVSMSRLLKAP